MARHDQQCTRMARTVLCRARVASLRADAKRNWRAGDGHGAQLRQRAVDIVRQYSSRQYSTGQHKYADFDWAEQEEFDPPPLRESFKRFGCRWQHWLWTLAADRRPGARRTPGFDARVDPAGHTAPPLA